MSTVDYFSETDWASFVVPSDRYTVLSAAASQMHDGTGALIDSVEINFTLPGKPGVFTVERDTVDIAHPGWSIDITLETEVIEQLYAL